MEARWSFLVDRGSAAVAQLTGLAPTLLFPPPLRLHLFLPSPCHTPLPSPCPVVGQPSSLIPRCTANARPPLHVFNCSQLDDDGNSSTSNLHRHPSLLPLDPSPSPPRPWSSSSPPPSDPALPHQTSSSPLKMPQTCRNRHRQSKRVQTGCFEGEEAEKAVLVVAWLPPHVPNGRGGGLQ